MDGPLSWKFTIFNITQFSNTRFKLFYDEYQILLMLRRNILRILCASFDIFFNLLAATYYVLYVDSLIYSSNIFLQNPDTPFSFVWPYKIQNAWAQAWSFMSIYAISASNIASNKEYLIELFDQKSFDLRNFFLFTHLSLIYFWINGN